jgi:hypothetical protein
MSDFKLNGLINPNNNNNLTTEQELKRVNVVLNGLINYILERMTEIDNKSSDQVISELKLAVNRQLKKEDKEFQDLFK